MKKMGVDEKCSERKMINFLRKMANNYENNVFNKPASHSIHHERKMSDLFKDYIEKIKVSDKYLIENGPAFYMIDVSGSILISFNPGEYHIYFTFHKECEALNAVFYYQTAKDVFGDKNIKLCSHYCYYQPPQQQTKGVINFLKKGGE